MDHIRLLRLQFTSSAAEFISAVEFVVLDTKIGVISLPLAHSAGEKAIASRWSLPITSAARFTMAAEFVVLAAKIGVKHFRSHIRQARKAIASRTVTPYHLGCQVYLGCRMCGFG